MSNVAHILFLCFQCIFQNCCAVPAQVFQARLEEHIEKQECDESTAVQVELLQVKQHVKKSGQENQDYIDPIGDIISDYKAHAHVDSLGGSHRFLLVRPCERFAGDGMSGLPRHRVTGECCGDGVCSTARWESSETCPGDCEESDKSEKESSGEILPPTESTLFGKLEGMEHDEYHCEGTYDETGSHPCSHDRNESLWLDSLLSRASSGTLPFDMPPPGSVAVEFGCGLGQDSRNIAMKAGYAVTAIDVSPSGIEQAKQLTPEERQGFGPGKIEFIAYDAMAVPAPTQRVDFFFDATVYCGLRFKYLSLLYGAWDRIFTPGHTLVHIQCWNWEKDGNPVPNTRRDMEADFEPLFDILHSEECEKNQGGPGWCFYMKLKPLETRKQTFEDRLKLQQIARDGDIEYLRKNFHERLVAASDAELRTLYHTAQANRHKPLMAYLQSISPKISDPFYETVYGQGAEAPATAEEDRMDGNESFVALAETAYLKANWERAEAEMLLSDKVKRLEHENRELRVLASHSRPEN